MGGLIRTINQGEIGDDRQIEERKGWAEKFGVRKGGSSLAYRDARICQLA